jgi:hypothetical protein
MGQVEQMQKTISDVGLVRVSRTHDQEVTARRARRLQGTSSW